VDKLKQKLFKALTDNLSCKNCPSIPEIDKLRQELSESIPRQKVQELEDCFKHISCDCESCKNLKKMFKKLLSQGGK